MADKETEFKVIPTSYRLGDIVWERCWQCGHEHYMVITEISMDRVAFARCPECTYLNEP